MKPTRHAPKAVKPTPVAEATEVDIFEADSRDDVPEPQQESDIPDEGQPQEPYRFFFLAAVRVLWVRDGKGKERTVNVLLNLAVPYISQNTMNDINRAACGRVMKENNVKGEDVREAIIMGLSILGQMTETMFNEQIMPTEIVNDAFHNAQDDVATAEAGGV